MDLSQFKDIADILKNVGAFILSVLSAIGLFKANKKHKDNK